MLQPVRLDGSGANDSITKNDQLQLLQAAEETYDKYAKRFYAAHHFLAAVIGAMSLAITSLSVENGRSSKDLYHFILVILGASSSMLITIAHALQLPVHADQCEVISTNLANLIDAIETDGEDVGKIQHTLMQLVDRATLLGLRKPPLMFASKDFGGGQQEGERSNNNNNPPDVFSSLDGTL